MHQVPEHGGSACPYCGRDQVDPSNEPSRLYGRFFMPSDLTACYCQQCGRSVSRFTRTGLVTNGFMSLAAIGATGTLIYHALSIFWAVADQGAPPTLVAFACALLVLALPFAAYAWTTGLVLKDTLYHGLSPHIPSRSSPWEMLRGVGFSTLFILLAMGIITLSDRLDIHVSGFVELLAGCMLLLTLMLARYFGTRIRITATFLLAWVLALLLAAVLLSNRTHPFSMVVRDLGWRVESVDGPSTGLMLAEDGHWGPVTAVAASSGGQVLASGSLDGTVKMWSATDLSLYATFECNAPVADVQFSPDGVVLAGRTERGDIFIWDVGTSLLLTEVQGTGYSAMAFQPGTNHLLTVRGRFMALLPRPYELPQWTDSAPYALRQVRFSQDNTTLLSSLANEEERGVALWRLADGLPAGSPEFIGGGVRAFAPIGSGLVAMVGRATGSPLLLWARATRTMLGDLGPTNGFVDTVAADAEHRLLCIGGENVSPIIWDGSTGLRADMTGHKGSVRGVAFTPDGTRLVTGDDSGTIRIWNIDDIFRSK